MLILSRLVGEEILIGDDIRLVVVEIQRGKIRLGIQAPLGTKIYRKELLERIQAQAASRDEKRPG